MGERLRITPHHQEMRNVQSGQLRAAPREARREAAPHVMRKDGPIKRRAKNVVFWGMEKSTYVTVPLTAIFILPVNPPLGAGLIAVDVVQNRWAAKKRKENPVFQAKKAA
jgi:hypothetical protein